MILFFQSNELKFALAVLKGILKVLPQDFLRTAIRDVEGDLQPPRLPLINYFHICPKCIMEVDERTDNALHLTTDKDDKWIHKNCPNLKPNRPV